MNGVFKSFEGSLRMYNALPVLFGTRIGSLEKKLDTNVPPK